jgi:SAM-dependent methyltransferase
MENRQSIFRCPICATSFSLEQAGDLPCGHQVMNDQGVLDFVQSEARKEEREFYQSVYEPTETGQPLKSIASLQPHWQDPWQPQNQRVFEETGDLKGKKVLLIGNGTSEKELYLLNQKPELLIYSDLTPNAVRNIQQQFDLEEHKERLVFAAVDAHHMPLEDNSIDLLYGYGVVHHLPDLDRFFQEAHRVLKPGGRTLFMDDAYAPVWHYAKQTVLRPLMKYSHRATGISPEDYRFSMSGGFRPDTLGDQIRAVGAIPWFQRMTFWGYVYHRGTLKLLPNRLWPAFHASPIAATLNEMDDRLTRFSTFRKNTIRLVWGLEKAVEY